MRLRDIQPDTVRRILRLMARLRGASDIHARNGQLLQNGVTQGISKATTSGASSSGLRFKTTSPSPEAAAKSDFPFTPLSSSKVSTKPPCIMGLDLGRNYIGVAITSGAHHEEVEPLPTIVRSASPYSARSSSPSLPPGGGGGGGGGGSGKSYLRLGRRGPPHTGTTTTQMPLPSPEQQRRDFEETLRKLRTVSEQYNVVGTVIGVNSTAGDIQYGDHDFRTRAVALAQTLAAHGVLCARAHLLRPPAGVSPASCFPRDLQRSREQVSRETPADRLRVYVDHPAGAEVYIRALISEEMNDASVSVNANSGGSVGGVPGLEGGLLVHDTMQFEYPELLLWDESFTTRSALEDLSSLGVTRTADRRRLGVDSIAAGHLLRRAVVHGRGWTEAVRTGGLRAVAECEAVAARESAVVKGLGEKGGPDGSKGGSSREIAYMSMSAEETSLADQADSAHRRRAMIQQQQQQQQQGHQQQQQQQQQQRRPRQLFSDESMPRERSATESALRSLQEKVDQQEQPGRSDSAAAAATSSSSSSPSSSTIFSSASFDFPKRMGDIVPGNWGRQRGMMQSPSKRGQG